MYIMGNGHMGGLFFIRPLRAFIINSYISNPMDYDNDICDCYYMRGWTIQDQ